MRKLFNILLTILVLLSSCTVEPEPIKYGEDACSFCRMTIMDRRFGAEIITHKGKILKYDAIECMLNAVGKGMVKEEDVAQYLVVDAGHPGELFHANDCDYLVSDQLPSPMGANLSAWHDKHSLASAQVMYKGTEKKWKEVKSGFIK